MSIDLIVPNMASYSNPEVMLMTKRINELINADRETTLQFVKVRNELAEIKKELKDLKNAWRNMG